jgi:hypothetical protein
VLDFLTTVAFLMNGGNPLVRLALAATPNPISGLLLVKGLAVALGVFCWWIGRERLLWRINILFAILIAWNLVALILRSLPAAA